MKGPFIRTAIAALILLAVPAARAEEEPFEVLYLETDRGVGRPEGDNRPSAGISNLYSQADSRGKLYDQWFLYRAAAAQGDREDGEQQFREVVLTFLREGFIADSRLAGALAYEGFRHLHEGDPEQAATFFQRALTLDPDLYAARVGMSRVSWNQGGHLGEAIGWRLLAANPLKGDWWDLTAQLANLALIVAMTLWIACPLVVIFLLLRNQGRWRHDLVEVLKRWSPPGVAGLLALAVIALPVFLWLGPGWLLLYWLVALFPYFRVPERILAVGCTAILILISPSQDLFRNFVAFRLDHRVQGILTLADGGFSIDSIDSVRAIVGEDGRSPELQTLLAQSYGDGGFSDEAYAQYRQILEEQPGAAWVYNNLGNLYLKSQQYGPAVQNYRKAIEIDPHLVEPLYNLHLAHIEQFHLVEAEEYLRRAQQMEPERISALVERGKKDPLMGGVLLPVDIRPAWPRLVAETWNRRPWDPIPEEGETAISWTHPLTIGGIVGLFAMGLLWLLRRNRVAIKCVKCGRPYCRRCQKGRLRDYCSQCHNVFMAKESLPAQIRAVKMQEISRFAGRDRWFRRFLTLIAPGGGHLFGGRTMVGLGFLAIWTAGWTVLGTRPILFPAPEIPFVLARPVGGVLTLILLAGIWLLANLVPSSREA